MPAMAAQGAAAHLTQAETGILFLVSVDQFAILCSMQVAEIEKGLKRGE